MSKVPKMDRQAATNKRRDRRRLRLLKQRAKRMSAPLRARKEEG